MKARAPREIWMMNGALLGRVDRLVVRVLLAQVAAEQADGLLEVVDVVGADGVLAVGVLETDLWS